MADPQERLRNVWAGVLAVEAPGNDPNKWTLLSCSKVYLINDGEHDLTAELDLFESPEQANPNRDPRTAPLGQLKRGEALLIDELKEGDGLKAGILPLLRYQIDLVFSDGVRLKTWFDINGGFSLRRDRQEFVGALNTILYRLDLNHRRLGKWTLVGWDTFADEYYPLPGEYNSEAEVRDAALKTLEHLDRVQADAGDLQDRVLVMRSNGTLYRYLREGSPG